MQISYTPSFVRQYKKLPLALREEAKEKIEIFRRNPDQPMLKTHKLKGRLRGNYSFSVNYSHRIVFMFDRTKTQAILLTIGDLNVYK